MSEDNPPAGSGWPRPERSCAAGCRTMMGKDLDSLTDVMSVPTPILPCLPNSIAAKVNTHPGQPGRGRP